MNMQNIRGKGKKHVVLALEICQIQKKNEMKRKTYKR